MTGLRAALRLLHPDRFFPALALLALVLALAPPPSMLWAQDEPPSGDVLAGPREDGLVDAIFPGEVKIEQVVTTLGNQAGTNITIFGQVPGQRISVIARGEPLEKVLSMIAQPKGWVWFKQDDGSYGLADDAWYKANILPTKVITKIFRPDHVQAAELERAISPMLTPGISTITADVRTNKLIVTDLPEVIERIELLIRQIDVQLFTRVFYIRHADVADVAAKIENYKSEPGLIEVDEKTRQIIVTDLLSNIKKMELLIDILDVGPEIVIYDVNNIGIEGEDLEDLQAIIDSIRTSEDLLFEVNMKQGVFILEDVPEVHERVEQILEGFDRPVNQVLIQGEILTTSFTRSFGYGLQRFAYNSQGFGVAPDTTVAPEGFRDIVGLGYPFFDLTGNVIRAAELSSNALFEWEASFEDSSTRVLLQPRLLVRNQEESSVFVGREEPFLTTFFDNGTNNNNNNFRSTGQQVVTDGLNFDIRPSISNSYLVELEIVIDNDNAEVVNRIADNQVTQLIARDRQSIETVLTIPSGQTRNIGGLITSSADRTDGGIPFLVKIPWIGGLFGSKSLGEGRQNLQLFITPTVVEDVIPRPTGTDGKRGRLVTTFDRVPGSFDMDAASEFVEGDGRPAGEGLLAPDEEVDAMEDVIEELLRETTPRVDAPEEAADSNFVRGRGPGGPGESSTIGGGSGSPRQPRPEPAAPAQAAPAPEVKPAQPDATPAPEAQPEQKQEEPAPTPAPDAKPEG